MNTPSDQVWLPAPRSGTRARASLPVRIPWKLSLFLLAVFAAAAPFDPMHSLPEGGLDLADTMARVEQGSIQRPVALFALGVFAIVMLWREKRRALRPSGSLGWSALSYLCLALASPFWAEDSALTVRRSAVLALLVLGALAVAVCYSRAQIVALTVCVCGLTLVASLVTQIAVGGLSPASDEWRFGGLLHPIVQGWNCGLLLLASVAMAFLTPRHQHRFVILSAVAFACLVLTKSRMPLASAVIGVAILGSAVVTPSTRRRILVPAFFLLVSLFLLGVILPDDPGGLVAKIAALGRGQEAESGLASFTGRTDVWRDALAYAAERPWLGYGYNAFLDPRNLHSLSDASGWVATSLHSGYIETLLGLGCVGTAALVVVLVLALQRSFTLHRCGPASAFATALLVWLICNLFLESTLITEPTLPALLSFAVIVQLAAKSAPALSA